jgi:hypothetical protein
MRLRNLFMASLLIAGFASIPVTPVSAQSVSDLRRRLGHPATEIYKPEKDVTVMVSYDGEGQVCELRLNGSALKIQELADKLVPVSARGRLLGPPQALIPVMNCCDSFRFDYERVIMTYFFGNDMDNYKFIYKGRKCIAPQSEVVTRHPR